MYVDRVQAKDRKEWTQKSKPIWAIKICSTPSFDSMKLVGEALIKDSMCLQNMNYIYRYYIYIYNKQNTHISTNIAYPLEVLANSC